MTTVDRALQRWRIQKASRFIAKNSSVLDIGSSDGALYRLIPGIGSYVGIDPRVDAETRGPKYSLVRGLFPQQLPDDRKFDVITMLAVLEHIPSREQHELASDCYRYLNPGGRVVITVPSERVDTVLTVLRTLRLVHGMNLEEHYGFEAQQTPALFTSKGFISLEHKTFQLGLNNLFVFEKN